MRTAAAFIGVIGVIGSLIWALGLVPFLALLGFLVLALWGFKTM